MLKDEVKHIAQSLFPKIVAMRRHLHCFPELSFQEFATAAFIKAALDEAGIAWKPIAGTGVLAVIEGADPSSRAVALRADIDALPISESNQVPYISTNKGVMHACGHDAHTSSLLGTAFILQQLKNTFRGTVKLLFQPGEEVLPGGAATMISEGALADPVPVAVIGQHVMPFIPAGKIGIRKGKFMASKDDIHITVHGKGGHGAQPHHNIDPVVIAAHIILALQQLVSRAANPTVPSVLSVGRVIADGSINIIPDQVLMEGAFRTMDEDWRGVALAQMKKMAEGIAESMGGRCDFKIATGYPVLINEDRLTAELTGFAVDYLGEENVEQADIWMASEDFSHYAHAADACFYLLGTGNAARGINSSLHTATFDIDEEALKVGSGLMAYLALQKLKIS